MSSLTEGLTSRSALASLLTSRTALAAVIKHWQVLRSTKPGLSPVGSYAQRVSQKVNPMSHKVLVGPTAYLFLASEFC